MRYVLAMTFAILVSVVASANPPMSTCGCSSASSGGKYGIIRIGQGCAMPNVCSNFFAERTFMFGSCNQFFNPGSDCGKGRHFATPSTVGGYCQYNSYLNR